MLSLFYSRSDFFFFPRSSSAEMFDLEFVLHLPASLHQLPPLSKLGAQSTRIREGKKKNMVLRALSRRSRFFGAKMNPVDNLSGSALWPFIHEEERGLGWRSRET